MEHDVELDTTIVQKNTCTIWTKASLVLFCLFALVGATIFTNYLLGSNKTSWIDISDHFPNDTQWSKCHGFKEDICEDIQAKKQELKHLLSLEYNDFEDEEENDFLKASAEEELYLTPDQLNYFILRLKTRKKRKLAKFGINANKWSLPILYKFDGRHDQQQKDFIRQGIYHWQNHTCIRFKEIPDDDPYMGNHLMFTRYYGCGSFIGKVDLFPQQIDLASRCLLKLGFVVHEIGHAIGFWHEHQRSDRNNYILIKTENAKRSLTFTSEFEQVGQTENWLPYDYGSVLHYHSKSLSVNGKNTIETTDPLYQGNIGQRVGLSFLDSKLANLAYCSDKCSYGPAPQCQRGGYQDPNDCTRCRCPDGFEGQYCDQLMPSNHGQCGGHFLGSNTPQTISSPNFWSGGYKDGEECSWLIRAPIGSHIILEFTDSFNIYCESTTCYHWVEVRYSTNLGEMGPRFCCNSRPQQKFVSEDYEMLIIFRTQSPSHYYNKRGFRAKFYTDSYPSPAGFVTTKRPSTTRPTQAPSTTVFQTPETCYDIAFILDSSGSVGRVNWETTKRFAIEVINSFKLHKDGDRFGVASFGNRASIDIYLDSYYNPTELSDQLMRIKWKDEMTNTSGGVRATKDLIFDSRRGERLDAMSIAILLTDGEANIDKDRTLSDAIEAKRSGITMLVIGVGGTVNTQKLKQMASTTTEGQNLYKWISGYDQLMNIATEQSNHIKQLKPTSIGNENSATDKSCKVDIAFVLDSSGSVGLSNWPKLQSFAKQVSGGFKIGDNDVLVGVISFGNEGTLHFPLNEYKTESELHQAIEKVEWKDQWTNTSGGIWRMHHDLFNSRNGDRADARNVAILITDGEANKDMGKTRPEALFARQSGIYIIGIGVGADVNKNELIDISSETHFASSFNDLEFNMADTIIPKICTNLDSSQSISTTTSTTSSSTTTTTTTTPPTTSTTTPAPTTTKTSTSTTSRTTRPQYSTTRPTSTVTTRKATTRPTTRPTTTTQAVPVATSDCKPFDLVLLLDSSGSVGKINWRKTLSFVHLMTQKFDIPASKNRIGVVSIGNQGYSNINFDSYTNPRLLSAAIDSIPFRDEWTNTSGGLNIMRQNLFEMKDSVSGEWNTLSENRQNSMIGILITDGPSNKDRQQTLPQARLIHKAKIIMLSIGIGNMVDEQELLAIASEPQQKYLHRLNSFDDLSNRVDEIADVIRTTCTSGLLTTPKITSTLTNIPTTQPSKPTTIRRIAITAPPEFWGQWGACTEPCGGCGIRTRFKYKLLPDGTSKSLDEAEKESCNTRICTVWDQCRYYANGRFIERPCSTCCTGYHRQSNICVRNS